jgi:hypothetical protein
MNIGICVYLHRLCSWIPDQVGDDVMGVGDHVVGVGDDVVGVWDDVVGVRDDDFFAGFTIEFKRNRL